MSNYVVTTNFTAKDSLISGNPLKAVKGADIGLELTNIATAVATKYDSSSAAIQIGNGAVGTPAYSFSAETGSGLYRVGAGDVGLSILGVEVMDFQAAAISAFNSNVAALAQFNIVNNSTTDAQGVRFIVTSGATTAQLFAQNAGYSTQNITNGAVGANITLKAFGNTPFQFGVNNLLTANITQGTNAAASFPRFQIVDRDGNLFDAGYREMPNNAQAVAYTLILSDSGKLINQSTVNTVTIPANASVAFPIGTVIGVVNRSASPITIPITTDTLTLAGTATTGTRTVAANGLATLVKITATSWLCSGPGVS